MYSVGDIAPAVERVRAAGGTATEPDRRPYGITAECADDQGTRFYLGQLS
jgi:predicted enzyme related to lactoylglutathione lyase